MTPLTLSRETEPSLSFMAEANVFRRSGTPGSLSIRLTGPCRNVPGLSTGEEEAVGKDFSSRRSSQHCKILNMSRVSCETLTCFRRHPTMMASRSANPETLNDSLAAGDPTTKRRERGGYESLFESDELIGKSFVAQIKTCASLSVPSQTLR